MKIALCTTTIHIPHALKLLRKCSPDVKFFVAGDRKTPHDEVFNLLQEHCNPAAYIDTMTAPYLVDKNEDAVSYKCSELIGWNTLARRNIAFLEALKWGADVIYSWDDDNLTIDGRHFEALQVLDQTFDGISVDSAEGWFDPGQLLIPAIRHRGISYATLRSIRARPVVDISVGVVAGLVIGDPDIDATTRMEIRPDISTVHVLGSAGVVVQCDNWTVFNSQNTAVVRELIPAWFMMPNVGRHDDIYASLIVQRVARERNLHVHFGQPFTYQQRNEHDLLLDLKAEISGMENTTKLADLLDSIILKGRSVIEDTRTIYQTLLHCSFIPEASVRAGLAYLEDCESILC